MFRDRFHIPVPTRTWRGLPFRKPARLPRKRVSEEKRAALGGYLPAPAHRPGAGDSAARGIRPGARGHRRARDLHHDGLRAAADRAAQGQEHRQECGADRAGRGTPPSAWSCSTRSASTPRSVSCTRRRTPRPSCRCCWFERALWRSVFLLKASRSLLFVLRKSRRVGRAKIVMRGASKGTWAATDLGPHGAHRPILKDKVLVFEIALDRSAAKSGWRRGRLQRGGHSKFPNVLRGRRTISIWRACITC